MQAHTITQARTIRGVLLGAVLAAALVALSAQAAQAATIHACVKPKSGATRIVSAKTKCHHGEQKLSWNTTGPKGASGVPGAPGAAGSEGKAGTNGVGTDYAASEHETQTIGEVTFLLNKVVPPGSYSVFGKLELAADSNEKGAAVALCAILDTPGTTPGSTGMGIDNAVVNEPLGELKPTQWEYNATVALEGTFTSKVTSTVTLGCGNFGGTLPVSALYDQLQAISVTGIL
jgi:hypothetical protein